MSVCLACVVNASCYHFSLCSLNEKIFLCSRRNEYSSTLQNLSRCKHVCHTKINILFRNRLLEHAWLGTLQNSCVITKVKYSLTRTPRRNSVDIQTLNHTHTRARTHAHRQTHRHTHTQTQTHIQTPHLIDESTCAEF